jgi:hypothetical protein
MIELLAMTAFMGPTGVFEAHDRQPTYFGAVTRASGCHDPDDANGPDHDSDCDDMHGAPVDGGWMPTVMLAAGGAMVLMLGRRRWPR